MCAECNDAGCYTGTIQCVQQGCHDTRGVSHSFIEHRTGTIHDQDNGGVDTTFLMSAFKHAIIAYRDSVQGAGIELSDTAVELELINTGILKKALDFIAQFCAANGGQVPLSHVINVRLIAHNGFAG